MRRERGRSEKRAANRFLAEVTMLRVCSRIIDSRATRHTRCALFAREELTGARGRTASEHGDGDGDGGGGGDKVSEVRNYYSHLAPCWTPTRDNSCLDVCTGCRSTISGLLYSIVRVHSQQSDVDERVVLTFPLRGRHRGYRLRNSLRELAVDGWVSCDNNK